MKCKLLTLLMALVLCVGCFTQGYYQCNSCSMTYKARGGLPGQFGEKISCRNCGGTAERTTEAMSGWDEERYQQNGNEVDY